MERQPNRGVCLRANVAVWAIGQCSVSYCTHNVAVPLSSVITPSVARPKIVVFLVNATIMNACRIIGYWYD